MNNDTYFNINIYIYIKKLIFLYYNIKENISLIITFNDEYLYWSEEEMEGKNVNIYFLNNL